MAEDGGQEAAAGQWRGILFGEVEKGGEDVDEVGSCGDAAGCPRRLGGE